MLILDCNPCKPFLLIPFEILKLFFLVFEFDGVIVKTKKASRKKVRIGTVDKYDRCARERNRMEDEKLTERTRN